MHFYGVFEAKIKRTIKNGNTNHVQLVLYKDKGGRICLCELSEHIFERESLLLLARNTGFK